MKKCIFIICSGVLSITININSYAAMPMSKPLENESYSTGSAKADEAFATYISEAKKGNEQAHFYLAMAFCREFCLKKDADQKSPLRSHIEQSKLFGIETNYVKAYAHFLNAQNFKTNFGAVLKKLRDVMTNYEVQQAEQLAEQWKLYSAKK